MRYIKSALWLAAAACAVVFAACSSSGTTPPEVASTTGKVAVYVTDAPADVTAVRVKVSYLAIYSTMGDKVTLVPSGTSGQVIDLVQAHTNPAYLGQFNIPAGDYNGIEGTIEGVDFTVSNGDTCTFATGTVNVPKVTMNGVAMHVDATTGAKLTIDIPVISGVCPGNGMQGTLSFGMLSLSHTAM